MMQELPPESPEFREFRNELKEKIKLRATFDQVACNMHKLLHKIYDSPETRKDAS